MLAYISTLSIYSKTDVKNVTSQKQLNNKIYIWKINQT